MRRLVLWSAWSAALLLPAWAHGWGPNGHRVVGQIAQSHLSAHAAAQVREVLGHETLAQASTWADWIRSHPDWRHASPWHYVTIEDDETYESSSKNPAGDIVKAMERFRGVLQDDGAERQDRVEALRWLVHLVGDVHQPLHVGRGADRGGNLIEVRWFGEASNLHSVWDREMIASTDLSFTELAAFLDHPTSKQLTQWQATTPLDWVRESKALRPRVYDLGDKRLGYEYLFHNLPVVEERLLQAGVRLAGLLNSALAPSEAPE